MERLDDVKELLTDEHYLDCCNLLQAVYNMEQFSQLTRDQRCLRRALRREALCFCDRSIDEAVVSASAPPLFRMYCVAPVAAVLALVAWYLCA